LPVVGGLPPLMLFLVFREGTGELVQAAGPAVGGMFIAS